MYEYDYKIPQKNKTAGNFETRNQFNYNSYLDILDIFLEESWNR